MLGRIAPCFQMRPDTSERRRALSAAQAGQRVAVCTGVAIGILLATTGCQTPPAATGPTEMLIRIPDREAFLDATLTLLRRYDLPPQYVDRAGGKIITERATSGQWFEFWRVDSQGPYQLLESSLHTMGRVVTVTIEPAESSAGSQTQPTEPASQPSADTYRLAVQVDKARYSAPERQVTTASGALSIYSERIPTAEGLRRARTARAHWVPLGRDPLLEAYLLARLADAMPDVQPLQ